MLRLISWMLIFLVPATFLFAIYFPQYWEVLLMNLVFYSKLVFKMAKAEVLLFISKMTVLKLIILALKRFVMDNIVSRAISDHFTAHVAPEAKKWWKSLDFKGMLLWFAPASVITLISTWFVGIANTTLFLFIKTLVAGFFKLLWLVLAKIYLFVTNSILAQIVEILALSYLVDKLTSSHFFQKWLKPILGKIVSGAGLLADVLEKRIHKPINDKVGEVGMKAAAKIRESRKKRQQEERDKNNLG